MISPDRYSAAHLRFRWPVVAQSWSAFTVMAAAARQRDET